MTISAVALFLNGLYCILKINCFKYGIVGSEVLLGIYYGFFLTCHNYNHVQVYVIFMYHC